MIIVAGALTVDDPAAYVASCHEVIRQARAAPGCLDFHLAPDPLDPGRVNVFEQWEAAEAVEAFRGSGPEPGQLAAIRAARVVQHVVERSDPL